MCIYVYVHVYVYVWETMRGQREDVQRRMKSALYFTTNVSLVAAMSACRPFMMLFRFGGSLSLERGSNCHWTVLRREKDYWSLGQQDSRSIEGTSF